MQSHITICLLYVTACNATKIPGVKVTFESLFWIADGQRLHITIYGVGCIIFVSWQKILSNMVKGGWFIGRNAALIGQWLLLTRWSSETWHMKKDNLLNFVKKMLYFMILVTNYWNGFWTTCRYANSRVANSWTRQLVDWISRRLVNSKTSQLLDWASRRLDNSQMLPAVLLVVMAGLCNRRAIIFLPCSFFISIFYLLYGRPM